MARPTYRLGDWTDPGYLAVLDAAIGDHEFSDETLDKAAALFAQALRERAAKKPEGGS